VKRTIVTWLVVTAALRRGYVAYLRSLPKDDLVMANTLGFQVLVSAFVIGLPSLAALALFLIAYPAIRDTLRKRDLD